MPKIITIVVNKPNKIRNTLFKIGVFSGNLYIVGKINK